MRQSANHGHIVGPQTHDVNYMSVANGYVFKVISMIMYQNSYFFDLIIVKTFLAPFQVASPKLAVCYTPGLFIFFFGTLNNAKFPQKAVQITKIPHWLNCIL